MNLIFIVFGYYAFIIRSISEYEIDNINLKFIKGINSLHLLSITNKLYTYVSLFFTKCRSFKKHDCLYSINTRG